MLRLQQRAARLLPRRLLLRLRLQQRAARLLPRRLLLMLRLQQRAARLLPRRLLLRLRLQQRAARLLPRRQQQAPPPRMRRTTALRWRPRLQWKRLRVPPRSRRSPAAPRLLVRRPMARQVPRLTHELARVRQLLQLLLLLPLTLAEFASPTAEAEAVATPSAIVLLEHQQRHEVAWCGSDYSHHHYHYIYHIYILSISLVYRTLPPFLHAALPLLSGFFVGNRIAKHSTHDRSSLLVLQSCWRQSERV